MVTDGENLEGDALTAAEEAAKQDGLKIYTVGIGTAEGELIPLPSDLGGGFVKDETGALVKSHLDESGLKAIASATGGAYVHLAGQGEDFEAFLRTVFGAVTKHDLVYRQQKNLHRALSMAIGCVVGDVVGEPDGGHATLRSAGGRRRCRRRGRGDVGRAGQC